MTTLLQELVAMVTESAAPKKKKSIKTAAKRVYHRDYLRTKNKPYRKYDPADYAKDKQGE